MSRAGGMVLTRLVRRHVPAPLRRKVRSWRRRHQGYLILAFGQDAYLDMAAACAMSIRLADPSRRIQLVTDREDLGEYRRLFDLVTRRTETGDFRGPLAKLRVFDCSAFSRTMFVDGDCLLAGTRIRTFWRDVERHDFAAPGKVRTTGTWYGEQIADLCRRFGVAYLGVFNTGAFYFRKTEKAKAVFDASLRLYEEHGKIVGRVHRAGISDEPYLAVALGRLGITPVRQVEPGGRSWMISTIDSSAFDIDILRGRASFLKGSKYVEPAIVHFVGRKPRTLYLREINRLRGAFGYRRLRSI